jgi:hypothetical protein
MSNIDQRIRIVSDGTVHGTQVLMPDGTPLPNVQALEILPLGTGLKAVTARVTLSLVALDVVAVRELSPVAGATQATAAKPHGAGENEADSQCCRGPQEGASR